MTLTSYQRFELVIIPSSFLFGQILILIIGLNTIGSETWFIIGIPVLMGLTVSLFIGYFLKRKNMVHEMDQLESLFRVLVLTGGGVLIPLLLAQVFNLFTYYYIFSILSLIFSILGGTMSISCFLLFFYSRPIH
ncbi:MAG: hypothetical protein JSU57_04405 [Candidatus Heimdallarchaeota archaeon]|nr:MAG: hypothetical protein JSU57_04405 [Candidatus Heimdallarchaeota archaeon]